MKRKTLSQYLREGAALDCGDMSPVHRAYYACGEHPELGFMFGVDPILMIFIGKFGPDILKSIEAEHRRDFDHGWDSGRVWDREHVTERLTKAINGGVWDLHRRLHELPRLFDALRKLGYPGEARFTSVFRAIAYMSDVAELDPGAIATTLEECRL